MDEVKTHHRLAVDGAGPARRYWVETALNDVWTREPRAYPSEVAGRTAIGRCACLQCQLARLAHHVRVLQRDVRELRGRYLSPPAQQAGPATGGDH